MAKFKGDLILTDIDGTLTYATGCISQENADAIEYFMKNGGKFAYCTGRFADFVDRLPVKSNCPVVTLNGAMIVDNGQPVFSNPFKDDLTDIIRDIKSHFPHCFHEIRVCSSLGTTQFEKEDIGTVPIYKYVFVTHFPDDGKRVARYIKEHYGNHYETFMSWDCGVEILAQGSSKGKCALLLKEYTGAERLYCIGDYENDLSMIEAADIAFVPENAIDEIKSHADVIAPKNTENAIRFMIEYLSKIK